MEKCSHGGQDGACSTCGESKSREEQAISRTLRHIRHKILVMSGKGGVGKSSVAVALALSLARRGHQVGLMDVDLHGPNVLRMLGLKDPLDLGAGQFRLPPEVLHNLKVISIEALMRNRELAVIWRGPLKHQLIRQFLTEIQWGFLDYLVIDAPPGTGDEPMSVAQTIPEAQALIVTTPQEISLADVRKSINFCQKVNLNLLGLVENMSGYSCPHCGKELPLFKKGGGERTAQTFNVPFLGALPFDPQVVEAADQGRLLELSEEQSVFFNALRPLVTYLTKVLPPTSRQEPGVLCFAVPVADGRAAPRFSQSSRFALITVKDGQVAGQELLDTPPELAEFPVWLERLGVTHVLAADLGQGAREVFKRKGIEVAAPEGAERPEEAVQQYLNSQRG
ncbi:MAG: ATP-binding protein [Deltaproteobacteria bacterium]|nr:ATP-binding protein [Deltaproteobacteria bacterium]